MTKLAVSGPLREMSDAAPVDYDPWCNLQVTLTI
jgi:hypothetical protein